MIKADNNSDLRNRTFQYARRIIRLYCALPKNELAHVIGKQFLRSGTSVGANYREAFRSRSRAEFLAKTGDCLKEIEETAYWLELIEVETIIDPRSWSPSLMKPASSSQSLSASPKPPSKT